MGIVGCPLLVADEPGSWEVTNGGQLMADAIFTAQGKPGSPLRVIMIGTLAPAMSGWWHDLVEAGSHGSTYVQMLRGDSDKWDDWKETRRVNPLTVIDAGFRKKLRQELADAQADTRLAARYKSYRLNLPIRRRINVTLLTPDDMGACVTVQLRRAMVNPWWRWIWGNIAHGRRRWLCGARAALRRSPMRRGFLA